MIRRLTTVSLAAVLMLLSACAVDLQHGLSEQDANDIYVLLDHNGISAKKLKEEGGNEPTYFISVPKQDVATAMRLMRENSLPRPMQPGLSFFGKNKGMIPTQTEERAIFLEALAGEVSNALNRVDGVLEAKAIVMIPEANDLTQPEKKPLPSASVLVKYRSLADGKAPLTEGQVKNFVATAVPELKPEFITVIMSQSLPPVVDVEGTERLQDVFGIRMTAGSASQFKLAAIIAGLLVLGMAGFSTWSLTRGGGGGGTSGGRRRKEE